MAVELYIYWKVDAAQLQQALQATHTLQGLLRQRYPGLHARVLQRADSAGLPTLMEVYGLPGGLPPAVQRDIEEQAALHLAPLGPSSLQRHVERFEAR